MAGAQHRSVTGMDERTLGRIDLILFDADYRDGRAALEDSWRVAVMAADPRLRPAHELARTAAVRAANERRDPSAPQVATSTTLHRVALGVALLAGVVAVALPTGAIPLPQVIVPSGLLACLSVGLLWWLEPRRANGSLWGSRVPAVIHLGFAGLWLLTAGGAFVFRWDEVDTFATLPALVGLLLLCCAGLAALVLCGFAVRADRSGRQTGLARVTGDLIDETDAAEVFEALDRWWSKAGPDAMRQAASRVRDVRREVLARLRAGRLISEREERTAVWDPDPVKWTERRR